MNKQGLIAIFAVSLLLVVASSTIVVDAVETNGISENNNSPSSEFAFDGYVKTVEENNEIFTFQKNTTLSDLLDTTLVDDADVFVLATVVVNEIEKTIQFDIKVSDIETGEILLTFLDTIDENGITDGNEGIYYDLVPRIQTRSLDTLASIPENSEKLTNYLPKLFSESLKDKIVKALENSIIKKIIKSLGLAAIPVGGWALLLIKLGLTAYDINELANELDQLVRLAELDIDGCRYDSKNKAIQLAERFGGNNSEEWIKLNTIDSVKDKLKNMTQFRVAYVDTNTKTTYITDRVIGEDIAENIMRIQSKNDIKKGPGLSVYHYNESKAKQIAVLASDNKPLNEKDHHHTTLHEGVKIGFKHYHNANHVKGNDEAYPAHAFYGMPLVSV